MAEPVDLSSLVGLVAAVDVESLGDDEVARLVIDAERLLNALHCLSAVALDELERRGGWANDGALSGAGWAAGRTGTPARVLRARGRAGTGLRRLPAAGPAARAGRLSPQHVAALAGCSRRHPDLAARDEAALAEQAETLDADAFAVVARRWSEYATAVEAPDPAHAAATVPVDEVHLSRTFDGGYRLDGHFSAETGELVHAALDAEVDRQLRAARHGDPSVSLVASQVRAAALVDLAAQGMRREPSDVSAPDRYRVAVVVHADQSGEAPLAVCDSPAYRVVLGAPGEVLDVGRLTPAWPPGIRRAVTLRDRGCVFAGCDRPPSWCDVHHCQPWNQGGTTSVDNGALLCRRHHTFIHRHRWTVTVEHGQPVARRADGTRHHITRWETTPPGPGPPPLAASA